MIFQDQAEPEERNGEDEKLKNRQSPQLVINTCDNEEGLSMLPIVQTCSQNKQESLLLPNNIDRKSPTFISKSSSKDSLTIPNPWTQCVPRRYSDNCGSQVHIKRPCKCNHGYSDSDVSKYNLLT